MSRRSSKFQSILHSADLLDRHLTTLLSSTSISRQQARVLNALSRMGEVSQKALIDSFDVTSGSMSTMIDRMETADLVTRRKNPNDRRADLISITPHGAAILNDVRDVWRDMDELIESKLGAEKMAQLVALTRELKFALGGKVAVSSVNVERARRATKEAGKEPENNRNDT